MCGMKTLSLCPSYCYRYMIFFACITRLYNIQMKRCVVILQGGATIPKNPRDHVCPVKLTLIFKKPQVSEASNVDHTNFTMVEDNNYPLDGDRFVFFNHIGS